MLAAIRLRKSSSWGLPDGFWYVTEKSVPGIVTTMLVPSSSMFNGSPIHSDMIPKEALAERVTSDRGYYRGNQQPAEAISVVRVSRA